MRNHRVNQKNENMCLRAKGGGGAFALNLYNKPAASIEARGEK